MSAMLPMVFQGLGAVGSAVGAISQGQSAAAEANYQAEVARNNAIVANQNANYAVAAGEAKATDQSMRERGQMGATRAALAASGVDSNTGSAADVRQGLAETGQVNIERVRQDASVRAYGYRTQSVNFNAEAGLQRMAASNASTGGFLKAGGLLLSGASGLATKWDALTSTASDVGGDFGGGGDFGSLMPGQ